MSGYIKPEHRSTDGEVGIADAPQMRWTIVEHMMREYDQFHIDGLLEDADKVFNYVVSGSNRVDKHGRPLSLAEVDRNARGYGWEAALQLAPGDPLPETLEVSKGNPFVRDDRKEVEK